VDKRTQQEKILRLGHAIALQAVELPPHERQTFIKSETASIRQVCGPIYPSEELLDSMEEWVAEIVKILAADDGAPIGQDRDKSPY
jgi:hypothetical protein